MSDNPDLTLQELELASKEVREKILEIPNVNRIAMGVTDEAIDLAETYITERAP